MNPSCARCARKHSSTYACPTDPVHAEHPRIALTAGEPAGIGPELLIRLAEHDAQTDLVAIGDPQLLAATAESLGSNIEVISLPADGVPTRRRPGTLPVLPVALAVPARPGHLDARNAVHVLAMLKRAAQGAASGEFAAIVTAPVHKAIINDAGLAFTGHTEFFAALARRDVVMMLTSGPLRVALVTTHLPLARVPAAITHATVARVLRTVHDSLQAWFGIEHPRIAVLGLNPHAGEGGHLGREEIDVIAPVIDTLRAEGMTLSGPLPADTAFVPRQLQGHDAVVAMYHDQGLPVLKHAGFGNAVNITLGLPYIRTSVDHGTALDLAGTGQADAGSMLEAVRLAVTLACTRAGAAP